jgi:TRAP-type mannitol/chloroaromatic compound transport system permease large subunit
MRALTTMVPPLFLIFLVLGTIFMGIATPTEGGAIGATGALIMALARQAAVSEHCSSRRWSTTAKLTTFVIFILVGARVFSR